MLTPDRNTDSGTILAHQLFEAQVKKTPHAIAVIDGMERIPYRTLNQRANQLAHVLQASGALPESLIGVSCERSPDMIVALLAVLKSGGAYVPLDPSHPRERLEFICRDAQLSLLLTQTTLAARLGGMCERVVSIDALPPSEQLSTADPKADLNSENASYVLYTSGSTGRPKGVVGRHGAVANRILWADETYPYQEGEVACARTTLGFIDSVAEILVPLALGAPLVLIGSAAQRDPTLLLEQLAAEGVTRILLVPSLLGTLIERYPDLGKRLPRLRYVFVSGEAMPVPLVENFKRTLPGRKLINIYGTTEVTGDATYFDFDEMPEGLANSPIGRPLRGVRVHILDAELREVLPLEIGEICIAGACLARGYLNRLELTAAQFVPSPFPKGGQLYRTGDLGRRLASRDIEYLGRIDQQVKLSGQRVELGEVECRLAEVAGVRQIVVVAQEDTGGRKILVAFYTSLDGRDVSSTDLRAHLHSRLPDYMIPGRYFELDALPLNANGKVDRLALQTWKVHRSMQTAPPASAEEQQIAAIWESVLGLQLGQVGRLQSFFELGGNSIDAIRIATLLRERFQQEVPIAAIFQNPTVADLTSWLTRRADELGISASLRPIVISGRPIPPVLPLSHHQFGYWFFYALTGDVSMVSDAFGFSATVDIERLQGAYSEAVASFDSLWMRFSRWKCVQRVTPRRPCRFAVIDRQDCTVSDREVLQEEADANASLAFALDSPPHVHARLVKLPSGEQRFLVAVPHVVADQAAMELFRRKLQQSYARRQRESETADAQPTASLRDLIEWERVERPAEAEVDLQYWNALARGPALNRLPGRLFVNKRAGHQVRAFSELAISDELFHRLTQYAQRRAASLPIVLIAALGHSVTRINLADELTLLLMLEKRDREALRGLFLNLTALMRLHLCGCRQATPEQFVERTREQLMASYDHSDFLAQKPTRWNRFWSEGPRLTSWLVRKASAYLARAWPDAQLDDDLLAEYVFALVPNPQGWLRSEARPGLPRTAEPRELIIAMNILPEVYMPEPTDSDELRIIRKRGLELILRSDDLLINGNVLIDLTLQVHLSRNEQGQVVSNLYGGGIDPEGLDEINDQLCQSLQALATGNA